jgi:hypothetical protein
MLTELIGSRDGLKGPPKHLCGMGGETIRLVKTFDCGQLSSFGLAISCPLQGADVLADIACWHIPSMTPRWKQMLRGWTVAPRRSVSHSGDGGGVSLGGGALGCQEGREGLVSRSCKFEEDRRRRMRSMEKEAVKKNDGSLSRRWPLKNARTKLKRSLMLRQDHRRLERRLCGRRRAC